MPRKNSVILQTRIEGLSSIQDSVLNRLRALGVDEQLIISVWTATRMPANDIVRQQAFDDAEGAIITSICGGWNLSEEDAIVVLNGKASPVQQC